MKRQKQLFPLRLQSTDYMEKNPSNVSVFCKTRLRFQRERTFQFYFMEIMWSVIDVGAFSSHVSLIYNSITVFITEVWSPSRHNGQRRTHGMCWWRGVDGILRRFLHSSFSYGNTGASAGNQHLITFNAAEHRYAHTSHLVLTSVYRGQPLSCGAAETHIFYTKACNCFSLWRIIISTFYLYWPHFCLYYKRAMRGHQFDTDDALLPRMVFLSCPSCSLGLALRGPTWISIHLRPSQSHNRAMGWEIGINKKGIKSLRSSKMAALKIFTPRVPMETLLSFFKRLCFCDIMPVLPLFLYMYLPTFLPFKLIFVFLFVPLSPSHSLFHLIRSALKSSHHPVHFSLQSV